MVDLTTFTLTVEDSVIGTLDAGGGIQSIRQLPETDAQRLIEALRDKYGSVVVAPDGTTTSALPFGRPGRPGLPAGSTVRDMTPAELVDRWFSDKVAELNQFVVSYGTRKAVEALPSVAPLSVTTVASVRAQPASPASPAVKAKVGV